MRSLRVASLVLWIGSVLALARCSEVAEVLTPAADDGGVSLDAALDAPTTPDAPSETAPPDASAATVTLDAGSVHACATIDGRLYCWGQNQRGRLGVGDALDRSVPTRVGSDSDWIGVTAAENHSCAWRADGTLACFGANDYGQLGVSGVGEAVSPVELSLPAGALQISAESNFSCAVSASNQLYCWGENLEGQLGQNDGFPGMNQSVAVLVDVGSDFTRVDAGQGHACALRAPGTLWCWGRNTESQLGLGDGAPGQTRIPGQTGASTSWIDVAAGQKHGCGIESGGVMSCWGDNQFGKLGTGDFDARTVPTPVGGSNSWVQVSLEWFHTCAIDVAGELWCWGRNVEGQLGLGDTVDRALPERVAGGPYAFVAVGRFFTCALDLDGGIWCAGANEGGQLGVGDTERRNTLSRVLMPVD